MSRPQFTAPSTVTREQSRGIVEIDATQSGNVGDGTTEDTIVRADPDEIWELTALDVAIQPTSGGSKHSLTIQSEQEGTESGLGTYDGTDQILYRSGSWSSPATTSRDNIIGVRVSDSNGLTLRYNNTSGATQNSDRDYSLAFEVIKA